MTHLGVVATLEVESSHTVQPSLPQFGRGAIALGQAVVEIQQLLGVILVGLGSRVRGGRGEEERTMKTKLVMVNKLPCGRKTHRS